MNDESVARIIFQDSHEIIHQWIDCVKKNVPAAQGKNDFLIKDHLEQFLENLSVALRNPEWKMVDLKNLDIGKKHGEQRARIPGYSLDEIITEYHLLRTTLFDHFGNESLAKRARNLVNEYIDEAIRKAVTAFEESAKEADEVYHMQSELLGATSDFLWVYDESFRFVFANDALLKLWGKTADEAFGKTAKEIGYSDSVRIQLEENARKAFQGESVRDVTEYTNPSGESGYYFYSLSPIKGKNGKIKLVAGVSRDITNEKAAQDALERSLRARDDFMSIISHEFKTPLTTLTLQSQNFKRALSRKNDPSEVLKRSQDFGSLVEHQVKRLNRLIDDMLDVEKINLGMIAIEKEFFSLSELVNSVTERMSLEFVKPPHLDLSPDSEGYWDKSRIEQVVINLLTNAIKYGDDRYIEIEVYPENESVILEVTDHGPGVSEKNRDNIFERYDRGDIVASDIKGLGLGLYICRKIVDLHGGSITVDSEEGQWTTFRVELPKRKLRV